MYYADRAGLPLDTRLGFGAVLGNAIIFLFCLFAMLMLRKESSASWAHRFGLGILATGAFAGAAGLLIYDGYGSLSPVDAIMTIQSLYFVGQALAILGAFCVLFGLTMKKAFLLPPVINISIFGAFILAIKQYPQSKLFLTVSAPMDFFYEGMLTQSMFSTMIIGMLSAFILFKFLSLENIKPLKDWTSRDIAIMRREGIIISILATFSMIGLAINQAMTTPFTDLKDSQRILAGIAVPAFCILLSFGGVPFGKARPFGTKSIYTNIIGSYMACAFAGIGVFIGVVTLGVYGLVYVLTYPVSMYLVHRWASGITPERLREHEPAPVFSDMDPGFSK
jgi:hypothetical protein